MEEQLLGFSYYENFKFGKELALILPIDHPKRVYVQKEIDKILEEWKKHNN